MLVEGGSTFILLLVRLTPMILILPGIGARYILQRHRIAFSFLIGYFCLPAIIVEPLQFEKAIQISGSILIFEFLIGTMYGITLRSLIFSLQIAGAVIAQSISLAQLLGANVAHDSQSSISNILTVCGVTLLVISGFLENFIFMVVDSYSKFPIGTEIFAQKALTTVQQIFSSCLELSMQLSMPFILLATYYNMLLAVVNRAMPQLLVSFIGVPAVLATSLALFLGLSEPILKEWRLASFNYTMIIGQ